jgi:regulator of protease activity HflC (stomatin/prohibitin superfamily)
VIPEDWITFSIAAPALAHLPLGHILALYRWFWAGPWGAKVTRVETKDIVPPTDLAGAMAR